MLFLILANSADPDKMQHNATFYLGRRCLEKYPTYLRDRYPGSGVVLDCIDS